MRRVGERLDRLEWKPVHTRITLALGIGWMLDAFEVNIVANVLGILQRIWHLSNLETTAVVSIWLFGIMAGAVSFGYLADRFGRRKLFLITLLIYSSFTVISALSPGYFFFLCFRFLTAIGVGAEYSAINAAIGELVPARYRGRANAAVMTFWPIGTILAAAVSLYFINVLPQSVGWRLAFGLGAIIALFTVWARTSLPESPRWLVRNGRADESAAVLDGLEAGTSRFDPSAPSRVETTAAGRGFFEQLTCLAREYPQRLALGCSLDFAEAAGYYGIFAFLPIVVLPHLHISERQVPMFFLLGNTAAVFGGALAAVLLDKVGRRPTVTSFYLLASLSMLGMGVTTMVGSPNAALCAFAVANLCATGSWVSAYPTFSEIFPTHLRSTGIGASVAVGRIGAALAPPLLVFLSDRVSIMSAFAVLAAFWALGAFAMIPWWLWGIEGRARPLEVIAGEETA